MLRFQAFAHKFLCARFGHPWQKLKNASHFSSAGFVNPGGNLSLLSPIDKSELIFLSRICQSREFPSLQY